MEKLTNIPLLRFPEFTDKWKLKKLGEVSNVFDGTHQTPNYTKEGIPFYSVEQITANDFNKTKFVSKSVFDKENKRVKIERGDILMTRIGDIGTARFVNWDVNASFYVSIVLIKQSLKYNSEYFSHYIGTQMFQNELWNRTIHVAFPKKINLGEISNCIALFPTLPEQQKIATFLTAVDEKLQVLKQNKKLLEQYKKGVMQQMFSQELRFKDDNGNAFADWEEKKLGDLTFKVDKKNKENIKYPVYSINNKEGFLPQSDQFEGMDSNDRGYDTSIYKVIESNTFAYNPARINVGSIGFSGELSKIIISSLYVCFKTIDLLEDGYLLHFLNTKDFNKSVFEFQEGGVRSYLFYESFSKIKIPLPSNKEQTKIANFLSAIDDKINHCQAQIARTEIWKKGLLQQMFC